jgi:hypothetical protein
MESAATTDQQGRFQIAAMPPGEYFVLYDSGLSDFEAALERWGGTTFRWFDEDWLDEYFGMYAGGGWAKFHQPQGVFMPPERLRAYCQFALLLGSSPFVLAHKLGQTFQDERILEPITFEVTEGQANQIEFSVEYFGE